MQYYIHEILQTSDRLLANLYVHSRQGICHVPKHWHQGLEIMWYANTPITLQELSKYCGLSKEHLARFFKKYFGTTFVGQLTQVRLQNALPLVMEGDLSMLQIALDCGFPDYRSFSANFKKAQGFTPLQYRKRYRLSSGFSSVYHYPGFETDPSRYARTSSVEPIVPGHQDLL